MRAILACAIAALLAAPQAVLAAKDGPDDAAAQPRRRNWLQRRADSLGAYNEQNAPGAYAALSAVGSALGLGESDGTEPPKPKRQCLDTEGADGECQLSAEAVCAAYASSDEAEAAATTPTLGGVNSIVAVFKGDAHRGVFFEVVQKENKFRKKTNRNKWKLRDSNGDERDDVFLPPANLRATSDEEETAFKAAVREAKAAKARGETPPPRLKDAPPIMPGAIVVVEAEPSDAEIKIIKDPLQKAMCASGYNPQGGGGKRGADGKLLPTDVDALIAMLDSAKCEVARRENKRCERSYRTADVRNLSLRKKLSDPES